MNEETGLEVVKLLLQQAWADERLVSQESDYVRGVAQRVCPGHLPLVDEWLSKATPLPMPNVAAVVPYKDEVMRALAQVTVADGVVHPDEQDMLRLLAEMLDV